MRTNTINLLITVVIAFILLLTVPSTPFGADNKTIWFEDIKSPILLTDSDKHALARFAATAILLEKTAREDIPPALKEDTHPRIVFLSVSDGATPAHVVLDSGNGITEAIGRAVSHARMLFKHNYKPKWMKLDIVQDVYSIDNFDLTTSLELERSLYGMAFDII